MIKDFDKVSLSIHKSVATITLNDPKTLNAFGTELANQLLETLIIVQKDTNVRVIVLEGANGSFSSGGNIKDMLSVGLEKDQLSAKVESLVTTAGIISRKLREIDKPIIAKLQGAVAGAGFNLALACDFRIASHDAKFIQSFIHIGLIPDAGGIYLLNQLIGAAKTTELTMLGDKLTAQQVYELNLLNKLVDANDIDQVIEQLAHSLAAKPQEALATIKAMINESAFSGLSSALDDETRHQVHLAKTDDFIEGVTAFVEKRKPNYA